MRILVIVPTLNEAGNLERTLPPLLAEGQDGFAAVVVSDGGSTDGTTEMAQSLGAEVVSSPPGRGLQLNRGAERALELGAEVLLFLHADTRLPVGASKAIREAVTKGAVGGAFALRFDDRRTRYRFASRLINLRSRLTRSPLGDQGQFVRRETFQALEGFRPWPILEDLDFIRRLRRQGRTAMLAEPVFTAARRYQRRGLLWTAVRNWLIFGLYFLGVSPHRLARLYR